MIPYDRFALFSRSSDHRNTNAKRFRYRESAAAWPTEHLPKHALLCAVALPESSPSRLIPGGAYFLGLLDRTLPNSVLCQATAATRTTPRWGWSSRPRPRLRLQATCQPRRVMPRRGLRLCAWLHTGTKGSTDRESCRFLHPERCGVQEKTARPKAEQLVPMAQDKFRFGLGIGARNRLKKFGFRSYREYLLSDLWSKTRSRFFKSDQWKGYCEICKRTHKPIELHHRVYGRICQEELTDLVALCMDCHDRVHFGDHEAIGMRKLNGANLIEKIIKRDRKLARLGTPAVKPEPKWWPGMYEGVPNPK